ncbi:MAG: hypothetical protein H6905_05110 [Hyphomicrobiales bacterium]|nr:hypothetical protein [Hyphomicrobiales bacterium]
MSHSADDFRADRPVMDHARPADAILGPAVEQNRVHPAQPRASPRARLGTRYMHRADQTNRWQRLRSLASSFGATQIMELDRLEPAPGDGSAGSPSRFANVCNQTRWSQTLDLGQKLRRLSNRTSSSLTWRAPTIRLTASAPAFTAVRMSSTVRLPQILIRACSCPLQETADAIRSQTQSIESVTSRILSGQRIV